MRITKLVVCLSFLLALPTLAQHDPRSSISIANEYPVASGGTTVGKLVVLDSTGLAIQTAATSSLSTLGIALTTSSSGAYIFVTQSGPSSCVMDGTSVVNDFITISTSVAGDCHDTGVASSAGTDAVGAGIPVIGVVQQVVTVGNPALIQLSASSVFASGYTLTLAKVNAVVGFSSHNTTLGGGALSTSSTGNSNTAMGFDALASLTTGSSNTGMGYDAGSTLTSGSQNTFLGAAAEPGDITDTNEIVLGYNVGGNGSNTATIGNSSVVHGYIGSNAICLTTGTDCPSGFITNPMTTLGDIIYGGTSGVPTRLAGVTATTTAGSVLVSNGAASVATAPVWISFQTELNASNLVVGTQSISGGSSGNCLYDNSGKLGEQACGAGTVVASAQNTVPRYSASGTATTLTGDTAFTDDGSGNVATKSISGGTGVNGFTMLAYDVSGAGAALYANDVTPGLTNFTLFKASGVTILNASSGTIAFDIAGAGAGTGVDANGFVGPIGATTPAAGTFTTATATTSMQIGPNAPGPALSDSFAGSANAITSLARFENTTTASNANGQGVATEFVMPTDAGTRQITSKISSVWADITNANRVADLVLSTNNTSGGGMLDILRLKGAGVGSVVFIPSTYANCTALSTSSNVVGCNNSVSSVFTGTGTFGVGTSDAITVTGASSSSVCVFSPTNSTAANMATVLAYISSVTTNSVTISHAATVSNGATVNVICK